MTYRAKNGKFVSKSNPVAVATIISNRVNAERAAVQLTAQLARRENARQHGYRGPLTRAELSRLATR